MAKSSFGKWQLTDLPLKFFASSSLKTSESPSTLGMLLLGTAAQQCCGLTRESICPETRRQGKTFAGLEGTGQGDNEGNARGRWRWPVWWRETGNQQVGKPGRKDLGGNWECLGREKPETERQV